ncbi:MAG: hypothetical protein NDI73_02745 [Desulfuromonadales bacterium]|nr:hypothetical protein [Desulfuromonadales bacterium]
MSTDRHHDESWTPLAEAARLLGTTPLNVLMHIKRGLLVGVELDSSWLVEPESLSALLRKRSAGAVPAVCRSGCGKAHGCQSCG